MRRKQDAKELEEGRGGGGGGGEMGEEWGLKHFTIFKTSLRVFHLSSQTTNLNK